MPARCTRCNGIIPPDNDVNGRRPCPHCGIDAPRVYDEVVGNGLASVGGTAMWTLVAGNTGRAVTGNQGYAYAVEWSRLGTKDELIAHGARTDFEGLLASAPTLSNPALLVFRGQPIRDNEPRPPSIQRMGPRPTSMGNSGNRYNTDNTRALYLSLSEDGVRRELDAWCADGEPYVIQAHLPAHTLRIADFTGGPPEHFLTAVFAKAEECKFPGRGGPMNYIFSQVVGELVASQFDGMLIPGVRGQPNSQYSNVVLFGECLDDWDSWVASGATPYLLPGGLTWMSRLLHEHIAIAAYFIWERDGRVHGQDVAHWFRASRELRSSLLP
jgi:hypothetical protein